MVFSTFLSGGENLAFGVTLLEVAAFFGDLWADLLGVMLLGFSLAEMDLVLGVLGRSLIKHFSALNFEGFALGVALLEASLFGVGDLTESSFISLCTSGLFASPFFLLTGPAEPFFIYI